MSTFEAVVFHGRVADFAEMLVTVAPCVLLAVFVLGYAWRRGCEHLVYED